MRLRSTVAMASVWSLLLGVAAACDTGSDKPDSSEPATQAPRQPRTSLPEDEVSVLADDDPAALAIAASQALYDESPVVVLAGADDPTGQADAAEAAVELGVPMLLTPPPADEAAPLREELARLGAEAVSTFGDDPAEWARQLAGPAVVPARSPTPAGTPPPALPPVARPEPLAGLAVLTRDGDEPVAAAATAQAAGARVLATGAGDPRTDPDLIATLADQPPTHTVALGDGFGSAGRLRYRLAVAATGVELPGGGQVLFPGRRFVALYGHPGDPVLGVLGEQPLEEAIDRAGEVAADYDSLVDEPVVPAMEIITTVASAGAGPEGDYSRRTPVDKLRPWIDAAAAAGLYVVLDLQPGHTDFLSQAKEYEELLAEPHVGLALDPEWRLASDQRHMEQIGSVSAAEVNRVVEWLADLTAEHRLPQKLLVLHQFTLRMITDREDVDTGRDELAVLIHVDGFGTPGQKYATWDALHVDPPPDVWWGWKNFYDEDQPTFSPARTVDVSPSPVFISYQ